MSPSASSASSSSPSMTTTTAAAMLARLRAYRPPAPSVYTSMPLGRRAAVLVILFSDRRGDLRVVLTLRSPTLRTHPGQVALPGGRADFLEETPMATARREAWEEIGLPLDSEEVEELTELPCTTTLAGTYLAVRPCVAFLKDAGKEPKLQEREVQALFTVRLESFLRRCHEGEEEEWYKGKRFHWNGRNWYGHEFMAPAWEHGKLRRHRVWGMTARILVEVARIAYGRDPEFPFDREMGFEEAIARYEGPRQKEPPKKPDPEVLVPKDQAYKGNL